MQETTTYNSTVDKPADYEKAVEDGLKTLDGLLMKIEINQAETARMKDETKKVAGRIREIFETF